MMGTLKIFDGFETGAGTKFVSLIPFWRTDEHIRATIAPVINDSSDHALKMAGTTTFFVIFGSYVVN